MRAWGFLLGGLIVWAVHFFSIYIVASIFLTSTLSRILTLVITLVCLAADGVLLRRAVGKLRAGGADEVTHWMRVVAALLVALSFIAVLWQGLPALII